VRRGKIWTLAGGLHYAGKPRPALVLQDNRFDATDSVTVCPFTTDTTEADVMRLPIEPNETNGLRTPCRLMVDKIVTVPKDRLCQRIGRLDAPELARLGRAVVVFLGVADVGR
jgi:mRNA interferase MazF